MNRIYQAASIAAIFFGGLTGCMNSNRVGVQERFHNYVDPCWPQRYSAQAREAVLNPFDIQVSNAQVIDQTIWNYHFKEGTDELTASGRLKLDGLARRLPHPDGRIYLQTARDLSYNPQNPQQIVQTRSELDVKRANTVLAYLGTQPTSIQGVRYEVQPIDPFDPGVNSEGPATSVRGLPAQYMSTLQGAAGQTLTGTGGGTATPNPGQGNMPANSPNSGATGGTSTR